MPRKTSARKSKPNKRNVNANKNESENSFKALQQNLGEETPDESDIESSNSSSSSFRSPTTDVNATDYGLEFTSRRSPQKSSRKSAQNTQQPRTLPSQQNPSSPQRTTRQSEVIIHSPPRQSSRSPRKSSGRRQVVESTPQRTRQSIRAIASSSSIEAGHSSRQVTEGRSPTSRQAQSPDARRRKQIKPKKRKFHVLKEIKDLQKSTKLLIPKLPFARLFREIALQYTTGDMRVSFLALQALQEATELYTTQLFQDAYRCTLHRGRVTLAIKDIELTRYIRGCNDPGNR